MAQQYHMMRIISGTLVNVGLGRLSESTVADMIKRPVDLPNSRKASEAYCSPPQGLWSVNESRHGVRLPIVHS
eukprot:SAG31_NODE_3350_length_4375_cov_1.732226_2_plen_73_part_00